MFLAYSNRLDCLPSILVSIGGTVVLVLLTLSFNGCCFGRAVVVPVPATESGPAPLPEQAPAPASTRPRPIPPAAPVQPRPAPPLERPVVGDEPAARGTVPTPDEVDADLRREGGSG